jgi:dephospho-CoA kinase
MPDLCRTGGADPACPGSDWLRLTGGVLRIGLTGGIGAGKSEVARRLAAHGAIIIDADRLAREVVAAGTEGLREITAAFGDRVLTDSGELDRAALAEAVFGDEAARRTLEGIIHPRVRARTEELTAAAPSTAVVVNDVPLLVEVGLAATYHLVIVVAAAESTRVSRLIDSRGMTKTQARARIRAQSSDDTRAAAADVLLRNDGDLADLHAEVDALWRERLLDYERHLRLRQALRHPEQLRLRPYDPTWPVQYERLAARIRYATGGLPVDHIGSTSVPGLTAKDVIDIQLTVADLAQADALRDTLAEAGFPPFPGDWHDLPLPPAPERVLIPKRLHGSADPGRLVHLHVRTVDSPGVRLNLVLRDWLRASGDARADYVARKQQLAAQGLTTPQYANAKEPWFDQAWQRAQRWAEQTGWRPPAR